MASAKCGDIFCELPKGCIITINAMGYQTEIAEKIVAKQADCVLSVKNNRLLSHEAITDCFEVTIAANQPDLCQLQCHEETDLGHGCIETRRLYLSTCLDTLPDAVKWKRHKGIDMIVSEQFINGELSFERRHYICTLTDVKPFAHALRAHWGIENSFRYQSSKNRVF